MKTFDKEKIMQHNTVVHCDTEKEANELLEWADSEGMRWCTGKSYAIGGNEWCNEEENTYYNLKKGTFGSITDMPKDYIILSYEDALIDNDYISIKDDSGKEYKFEKPNFECELLKIVDDSVIGYCYDEDGNIMGLGWELKNGKCDFIADYNLIPYKSEQDKFHEAINNGGALCKCWRNDSPEETDIVLVDNYNPNEYMSHDTVYHNARPLTPEEAEKYTFKKDK